MEKLLCVGVVTMVRMPYLLIMHGKVVVCRCGDHGTYALPANNAWKSCCVSVW